MSKNTWINVKTRPFISREVNFMLSFNYAEIDHLVMFEQLLYLTAFCAHTGFFSVIKSCFSS